MGTHEPAGIAEAFDELLRAGLLLGTRVAERHLREREEQLRDAASTSLDRARTAHEHHQAAQRAAITSLEEVHSDSWWRHASAADVRGAWITAREYQHEDPHAARAVWTIADELSQRFGLDVHRVDPAAFGTQPELGEHTILSNSDLQANDRRLRRELAARLRELDMPPQAIEAAMLADTGQALPPEMATASPAQGWPVRPVPARRTTHRQRKSGR